MEAKERERAARLEAEAFLLRQVEVSSSRMMAMFGGELEELRSQVGWLAGELAKLKACRHREGCRKQSGSAECSTCWTKGAEEAVKPRRRD